MRNLVCLLHEAIGRFDWGRERWIGGWLIAAGISDLFCIEKPLIDDDLSTMLCLVDLAGLHHRIQPEGSSAMDEPYEKERENSSERSPIGSVFSGALIQKLLRALLSAVGSLS